MDFELSGDQQDIVAAFDRALARESSIERVRAAQKSGYDPDLWRVLVEMDVLELASSGGDREAGAATELGLVAESLGTHLACVPVVEAGIAAMLCGVTGVVPSGDMRETPTVFSPRPARHGTAWAVPGGAVAQGIVVLDDSNLVLVRGAVADAIDEIGMTATANWHLYDSDVERTILASGRDAHALWRTGLGRWRIASAAVAVGIAQQALRIAVDYAREREQFGAPIGSFQSIQHKLAEAKVEVDGARLLARETAWRCDRGLSWETAAAEAYAFATDVAVRVAEASLHVHGGYGYTLEYDPQLYLRRAQGIRLHGGDPDRLWADVGAATMSKGVEKPESDSQTARLRAEVREFAAERLTPRVKARVAETGDYHDAEFHCALADRRWIGAHWAREEGGQGWPRALSDVVYEELAAAGAPVEGLAITQIIGEAIRRVGTPEQRERFLAPICRGEILLALGYTEPASGSDLASVQTRAVREGDGWILNGQKIFTTLGSEADYVFVLARTDPDGPKHAGLTLFLVPTDSPGFSAAPIYTLSGQRTNVTYYSDIRLDDSARLGAESQGWEIVNVALAFERGGEFAAQVRRTVGAAVTWAHEAGKSDDPYFLVRLGHASAAADVSRLLGSYASWSRESAHAGAVEGTIAKVYGTEALQDVTRSLLAAAGTDGLANRVSDGTALAGELQHLYRESQIATIYGGTSEVLKTVIAQQGLKLPRPPRPSTAR